MRRVYSSAAAVIMLNAIALPASAGDRFEEVRGFIQQQMTQKALPSVAVAVAQNGGIIWEQAFGWADREKRVAADAHTMYSLASISKPITATGLMILVERGAIDLDRSANDYLGAAKLHARIWDPSAATLRRIANHSAGLPLHYQFFYEDEPWSPPSMDETILRYGFLESRPGERFNYSNLGYGILGDVIERVARMSYADFMRREVFLPLGLAHTSVGIGPGLAPYAAQRYGTDGAPLPFYTFDHMGASAVYSSAHDLARFALFHLKAHLRDQKAILTDASIDAMHRGTIDQGHDATYGIGFNELRKDGYRVVSHAGGMGGVETRMILFPDEHLAVIVLMNCMDSAASDIANRIVTELLPRWTAPKAQGETRAAFAPPADWVGNWSGTLFTYTGQTPVKLTIGASGEVVAAFGEQLPALVDKPALTDGWLTGELRATIGTPDTERYRYSVSLELRREGDQLIGAATAVGEAEPRVRNALSHWIELRKDR